MIVGGGESELTPNQKLKPYKEESELGVEDLPEPAEERTE